MKSSEEEFARWRLEQSGRDAMTVAELRELLGEEHLECELCTRFDLEDECCKKDRRPRKVRLLDGPNTECHIHQSCTNFDMAKTDTDLSGLRRYWAKGVAF